MNSTKRRKAKATTFVHLRRLFTMRKCQACVRDHLDCIVSRDHDKCATCYRNNKRCDLSANWGEHSKFAQKEEELSQKIAEAEARSARLRRERKEIRRKLKALGDTEEQNIAEIEEDERQQADFDAVMNGHVPDSVVSSLDEFFAPAAAVVGESSGGSQ